jgi:hypothetical protein
MPRLQTAPSGNLRLPQKHFGLRGLLLLGCFKPVRPLSFDHYPNRLHDKLRPRFLYFSQEIVEHHSARTLLGLLLFQLRHQFEKIGSL